MKIDPHITNLVRKYLADRYTEGELDELLAYFKQDNLDDLRELIQRDFHESEQQEGKDAELERVMDVVEQRLMRNIRPKRRGDVRFYLSIAAALLCASLAWWNWGTITALFKSPKSQIAITNDADPGGNRATLTLADGSKIPLDTAQSGIIVSNENIQYNNGQSVHQADLEPEEARFLSLATPKGGQYQIMLADGTKVWLNAASTLTYPAHFSRLDRQVTLSGEGYFVVSPEKDRPFIVNTQNQMLRVMGTEFNLNAYKDESQITTTLKSGLISITQTPSGNLKVIKPGEQAQVSENAFTVRKVDASEFNAWKDGQFVFNNTNLITVLKQLERWYNIEVDYTRISNQTITASISRDIKLSNLLYALKQSTGLSFTLKEGRLLIEKR